MSFILDALKKSESDRQRQSGPSLFEVKVAPPRRRLPVWAVAIALLLGINVVVVSWMLLRRPAAQQAQQQPQQQAPRAQLAAQPAAAGNAPAAAPPTSAGSGATAQIPADRQPAGSGASTASAPAAVTPPSAAAAAQAPVASAERSGQPATASAGGGDDQSAGQAAAGGDPSDYAPAVEPAASQGSGAAGAADGLPLYQQIVTSDGLPALHLDLHVFTERPQDRFVMINMHRLGEGDSLPGGVQVDAIRPDGVVLTYRGTRFLLPRN